MSYVIQWLAHLDVPFIRINEDETINGLAVYPDTSSVRIETGNKNLDIEDISQFWYRRGRLMTKPAIPNCESYPALKKDLNKSLSNERTTFHNYLYHLLEQKKSIGAYELRRLNKLKVLTSATKVGLKIPETLITNKKSELLTFVEKHPNIIVKPIHEMVRMEDDNYNILTYTSSYSKEQIDKLDDQFFLSLVQNAIPKKYEIRIFYWYGKMFGNAIFSQSKTQTKEDWRVNINDEVKDVRRVPFSVPTALNVKLKLLMKEIGLKTGSIDMIVSPEKEFYFLEVNPVGQFGMTASVSNENVFKHIAEYFKNG